MTHSATSMQPVLVNGQWREAIAQESFTATNPSTGETIAEEFPVSGWDDCDAVLDAAALAFEQMVRLPGNRIADFLERQAERIDMRADEIVEKAHQETALPVVPRLRDVELPRTTNQLRQAAAAARDASWRLPTIDSKSNIRSYLAPLGTVAVLGPNNFPLAFSEIAGGDYAAAIAGGNPVVGKAHPLHPGTTRLLAEEAQLAIEDTEMPPGTVQLLYHLSRGDGERLVKDRRIGATAFTGSRKAGLALKAAADAAGKPIFLELSSLNPVFILPGAIEERGDQIAEDFTISCLMAAGQFCTNPGLLVLLAGSSTDRFVSQLIERFESTPVGTYLSADIESSLHATLAYLQKNGAQLLTGGNQVERPLASMANTLLQVNGRPFLAEPSVFQTEAFGNSSLVVIAKDIQEAAQIAESLEGSLTGSIYTDSKGRDEENYRLVADSLTTRVGRLLNDKMPTGVAVSPAMNHGGPFPATGHPHFTSVGVPAALRRFTALQCFDNVRQYRLPELLRDKNPEPNAWRHIDGQLTQEDITF